MRRGVLLVGLFAADGAVAADQHVGVGWSYGTIGQALAAAAPGDTVWIDPGTWDEALVVVGQQVTLRANGPFGSVVLTAPAGADVLTLSSADVDLIDLVIDGEGLRRGVNAASSVVDLVGCEVRNGGQPFGAGVSANASTVTIDRGRFRDNSSAFGHGGGLYAWLSTVVVRDAWFVRNRANGAGIYGGALMANGGGSLVVERSTFTDNSSANGGAISGYAATITVSDSSFTANGGTDGGAVYCVLAPTCSVRDAIFEDNTATQSGGAVFGYANTLTTLDRNLFCGNTSASRGGAVALQLTASALANNAFGGNLSDSGGALSVVQWMSATSENNSFVANAAAASGAVWIDDNSDATSANDLVAFHLSGPTNGYAFHDTVAPPTFDHALFWANTSLDHNGTSGPGFVAAEPQLVGWPGGTCDWSEFAPDTGSPAINAGNPAWFDPDGSVSDIGALGGPNAPVELTADADGDGWPVQRDCDDDDPTVHPLATEVCDGVVDEDCDGLVDNADPSASGAITTWPDLDRDGLGDYWAQPVTACVDATHAPSNTDCHDRDPTTWAGPDWYVDDDQDGLGDPSTALPACEAPYGRVADGSDCDDADPAVLGPVPWYPDLDLDGAGGPVGATVACEPPAGAVADGSDCDDLDPANFPANVEVCDGGDNDCDDLIDSADPTVDLTTERFWFGDADGDGFGAGAGTWGCDPPPGTVGNDLDCDDVVAEVSPEAVESCNGIDDDCSGAVDDGAVDATLWYADLDGDTWGDLYPLAVSCDPPINAVARGGDCADLDSYVHPGAPELCDGVDNDCDLGVDVDALDAELWYVDHDGDGHGLADADTVLACAAPPGFAGLDDDCDDTRTEAFPGASELCNGLDDDCDGAEDEDLTSSAWHPDADGDGFGDPTAPWFDCGPPDGYLADATDCDDTDPDVFPGASEFPGDGVDDNCDGADAATGGDRDWDTGTHGAGPKEVAGCGCDATTSASTTWTWLVAVAVGARRRRVTGRCPPPRCPR